MPLPFRQDAIGLKQARVALEKEYARAVQNTTRPRDVNNELLEKLDWCLGVYRREERAALRSGTNGSNGVGSKRPRRPARSAA